MKKLLFILFLFICVKVNAITETYLKDTTIVFETYKMYIDGWSNKYIYVRPEDKNNVYRVYFLKNGKYRILMYKKPKNYITK